MGNHRPKWRLPVVASTSRGEVYQSPLFKAKRHKIQDSPKCQGIAKRTGKRCGKVALQGATRCQHHGGLKEARATAEARFGKDKVVILRDHRRAALVKLGITTPWPAGLPRRPDLMELSAGGRGQLFEAFFNRETDPETYKHALRPRIRWRPKGYVVKE